MSPVRLRCAVVAAAIIVSGGCSKTDRPNPAASQQPGAPAGAVGTGGAAADVKSDGAFVHDVAIMIMGQIELSRLAVDRAITPEIKAFARKMMDDQIVAQSRLKSVVSGEWPGQLDDKQMKAANELAKKQGADFDRHYAKAMVETHQNLAALLESRLDVQSVADWKTAAAGRTQTQALPDPKADMPDVAVRPAKSGNATTMKINQWAADTYPVAQKHLDTARTLENATKKASTN